MQIQLSDHFNTKRLARFVLPSIIMMVFTSVYGVVDGFFVSNYAGKTPFAAVNLIMPFIMLISTLGFMIGTGGSALVSKTFGEGDKRRANELFSMLVYTVMLLGITVAILGEIFIRRVSILLGADEAMLEYCVLYGRITLLSLPFFMLQNVFQSFLVTAKKPNLGLAITVGAGVTNMVLDFIFVGVLKWGVAGAAGATAASEVIGGAIPLAYFFSQNGSTLRLGHARFDGRALLKTCTNGASELMTNVSMSLVNILYNFQLIKYFGENGVAAYGVLMYVSFIFVSIFIGYSIGVAPIIGYNYGARNDSELQNVFRKSMLFIGFSGLVLFALAEGLSLPLAHIFTGYDDGLYQLTLQAFRLFSFCYLVKGFNIFGSAFFTALNNGAVSAAISFLRTFLFQAAAIMLLPLLFGMNAIWLSLTCAEGITLIITILFMITKNKNYHYFKTKAGD